MPEQLLDDASPFVLRQDAAGIVVLHGFTGVPVSMRSVGRALADAGFSVDVPLLPGHGTSVADLSEKTYDDFLAAADSAYRRLADGEQPVVCAGLSMGGTLALSLALAHPEVAGLVLVNPMVAPPSSSFLELLHRAVEAGAETMPSIRADIAKPGVATGGYNATPVRPLISLLEATEGVAGRLGEISCPVLLFSSRNDHLVPGESSDLVEERVGGDVERVVLERSYHVATLDYDATEIEARTVTFAKRVCGD